MASDDQANPFDQPSHWPRLRQAPMRLGPLPKAAPRPAAPRAAEPPVTIEAPEPKRLPPSDVLGPNSIFRAAATPLPAGSPASSLWAPALSDADLEIPARTPSVEPPAPSLSPPEPAPVRAYAPEMSEADLEIPTPLADALIMPFAARQARTRARKPSRLVPVLAASVVGLAGVGLLAFLINAGQQASTPVAAPQTPALSAVVPDPIPPAPDPTAAAPAAVQPAAPPAANPEPPAPAAAPKPQRVAAAAVVARKPVAASPATAQTPLPVPDPVSAEPQRITIAPPAPAPAPAPPPAARAHASDPEAPISTHTPE